jgi:hypothetical protein
MPDDNEEKSQSIVKTLITKNTPAQQEDNSNVDVEEKEVQSDDSSAEGKGEDSKIEDSLVTDELAKLLNLPKGFIGKPLSTVGKSYRESLTWGNENNKKLIDLEAKLTTLEGQLSQTQIKKTEEEANKETAKQLGKSPDPVEHPEEFYTWLEKRDSLMEEKFNKILESKLGTASKELLKSIDDNPILKQAQEQALERTETIIYQKIQEALPKKDGKETIKAGDVIDVWFDYKYMVEAGIYKNRPDKFVRDVLTWLKAQSYDSLKNQKESDIIKKIHKKTKENLEKVSKTKLPIIINPRKDEKEEEVETIAGKLRAKLERQARLSTG